MNIFIKGGKKLSHKYYAADQLKEFVITCDISEKLKEGIKKLKSVAIDNYVIKHQAEILPQMFAAQRVNSGGKAQPPRMMSYQKFMED